MLKRRKRYDQFAVIGLGRFGTELVKALSESGKDVLAVDDNEECVQEIMPYATHAVTADGTDENALKTLEMSSFDAVVVAIGDVQASILTTMILKELGVGFIVAKACNDRHKKVLEKLGADYVLVPEADMADRVANRLINARITDLMEVNDNYSIVEVDVPESWAGKTLAELDIRRSYKVNVILVLAGGEEVIASPGGDTVFSPGDHVVVGGTNDDIVKFGKRLNRLT